MTVIFRVTLFSLLLGFDIGVYSFIRDPVIRRWNDTVYNVEHEDLKLRCEVDIEPNQETSFTWMFNGTTLTNGTKYTIGKSLRATFKGSTKRLRAYSDLIVNNISKHADSGNYTCLVDDSDNQSEKSRIINLLQIGQPQIIPEESEQIINFSDSYRLTCECSAPITWTYPTIENGGETLPEVVITSEEEGGYHTSKLHITNASDLAVGYYFCNETNNKDNYASTYLYVEGGDKLYAGTGEIIVASGKQYSSLIIPCRPTSPSVTVKLYEGVGTDNKDGIKLNTTTADGLQWTYKAIEGFTLNKVHHPTLYHYTCTFSKGRIINEVTVIADISSR